jgi:predicted dienelactone hydrolase
VIRAASVLLVALAVLAAGADAASPPVQLRTFRFVDHSRLAHFRDGTSGPRVLVTEVRYPQVGQAPYPLVVFAHGFAVAPHDYGRLLQTWARAGYVVAAPIFPVESPHARGGPSQSDLENEPRDLSFVISRLLGPAGPLRKLVDARKIAIAGQSDGGVAALTTAYDRRYRDRRIKAAIVMSGGPLPGFTTPPPGSPPLLAVQGTQDPLNSPGTTSYYYALMRPPKFLLWLIGAPHREPYSTNDIWAPVVRLATTRFLDHYVRRAPLRPLIPAGTQPGVARVVSER